LLITARLGDPLSYILTINPSVTGQVTFHEGNTQLTTASVDPSGLVMVTLPPLGIGSHSIEARFAGNNTHAPSSATAQFKIIGLAGLAFTSSNNPAPVDTNITLTLTVSKPAGTSVAPTGSVAFRENQRPLGSAPLVNGAASITIPASTLGTGDYGLLATYSGDQFYEAATTPILVQTVLLKPTVTTLRVTLSDTVNLRATVSSNGQPVTSGNVLFGLSNDRAEVPVVQGVAHYSGPPNKLLGLTVAALYLGNSTFEFSSAQPRLVLAPVNGFSFQYAALAPSELIALFGQVLGTPTSNATATIAGSDQVARAVSFYFVSPTQATFALPDDLPEGPATLTYISGTGLTHAVDLEIVRTAPGIASKDATGQGPPAAQILRVHNGQATFEDLSGPIAFHGDTLYLILYATGVRHAKAPVTCTVADRTMTAAFAGAQGGFRGLDQINLPLDPTLAGTGSVGLNCTADGRVSNTVQLLFP
jgi:uncharacterized protein (TIGR03437 family)